MNLLTDTHITLDPSIALDRIDSWLDSAVRLAPNVVVAIVVYLIFWLVGGGVRRILVARFARRGRDNLGELIGGSARTATLVLGALFCSTIVFPSMSLRDLFAGLGVGSVAIGFAFKDILQNWLAGLLILLRQPFRIGDLVTIGQHEGIVEHIETRSTVLRTFDGERVIIPNSDVYTSALHVKTAYPSRRTRYDVGIAYAADTDEACRVIKGVLDGIEDIEAEPAPAAFAWDLGNSAVSIRTQWWTNNETGDRVQARADAVRGIKRALNEAGIEIPYPTRVLLQPDLAQANDSSSA